MAFASDLVINNFAAVAKTFKLNFLQGTTSERIESTSTLVAPLKMVLRHSFTPSKGTTVKTDAYDRHTITFSKTVLDAALVPHVATVSVNVTQPRVSTIVRADIDDLVAFAANFITVAGNKDGILTNQS